MSELFFKTATELGRMVRARKISPVELTTLFLDRLEKFGPRYNALAELTRELALAQARRAERVWRKSAAPRSRIFGVPFGAKDLLAARNIPTRWGSPAHRDQIFDYDATVIARLRDAGAPLLGKLAMVEIAGGGGYEFPNASVHGPGLNPWNVKRWAGGSSSGSGSAVAAGLVPFALGSETWGSIVTPATYCGITGLRPTWGLVSRHGAMELAWTMDKVGPMARSAEDCGWVLQAIAGADLNDVTTLGNPRFRFTPRIARTDFRIGVLPADFSDNPEIENAFANALRLLRRAGLKLKRIDFPVLPFGELARTILDGEMAAAHEELVTSGRVDQLVDASQRDGLKKSITLTAAAFVRAQQQREALAPQVFAALNQFDALVAPSIMSEAIPLETSLKTLARKRGGYAVWGSLYGVPNLALPMGFGKHGLPLGISFTGNLFDENTLLQIGMIFQRETDWHTRHPNV